MPAGPLDQRVSLMRKTATPDGAGGVTRVWASYAEIWARMRPLTGRERENRGRVEAASMYMVTIRARADVLESDAIRWSGRDLNIRVIRNPGGRPQYLDIEAEIGVLV